MMMIGSPILTTSQFPRVSFFARALLRSDHGFALGKRTEDHRLLARASNKFSAISMPNELFTVVIQQSLVLGVRLRLKIPILQLSIGQIE